MNLLETISIFAGGPGSGCRGPNCGRPKLRNSADVIKYRQQVKDELVLVRAKLKIKRGAPGYLHKEQRARFKVLRTGLLSELRYYGRRDRLLPGMKRKGKLHTIPVQPVPKAKVKKQYVASDGSKVTVIREPKQYETKDRNRDWLRKPHLLKGQFQKEDYPEHTYDDNERNHWFRAHYSDGKTDAIVEIHRNLGDKHVNIIERKVEPKGWKDDAIVSHKEVTFNNIGRASGFMAKRYGITFKLK